MESGGSVLVLKKIKTTFNIEKTALEKNAI